MRQLLLFMVLGAGLLVAGLALPACGDDDYSQDAAQVKDLAVQLDLGPRDLAQAGGDAGHD
jgi:hypothetical protein